MKKKISPGLLLVVFLCFSPGLAFAESIDSLLLAHANAVINNNSIVYDVSSPENIKMTIKFKVTVLNQGGRDVSEIMILTDKDSRITDFSGMVKRGNGTVMTRLQFSDLKSYPAYPNFVFLSDDKVFYYSPVIEEYPYTVEYEYSMALNGLIAFDPWKPVAWESVSCDTSSYSIIYPKGYSLVCKDFNIPSKPVTKETGNREMITWGVGKIQAVNISSFEPPRESYLPCLYVMPENFNYDGYPGQVKDMAGYGRWLGEIQKGRDVLSPEFIARLKAMISVAGSTREKVEILYRFLQNNTRYVAIMFGIGGHQPAPASEVAHYGYGDCKGLSNYMRAMLATVGINSYYTVIGNGSQRIRFEEMPYFQTNHAILCVPDASDTIWLECTSSDFKAGYLGYSNSNRKALLVTEKGGVLVNTPRADSVNSYIRSKSKLVVTNNGVTSFDYSEYCTRNEAYESYLYYSDKDKEKVMKYLYNELPFKNYTIASYNISIDTNQLAANNISIKGQFSKYATAAGRRLIIPLVPYKLFERVPKIEPDRKVDIYIPEHLARTDTINITVPPGFKFTLNNEKKKFSNSIGTYRQDTRVNGKEIVIIRSVVIPARTYPASKKDEVTEFYKKCHDIEASSLICELAI